MVMILWSPLHPNPGWANANELPYSFLFLLLARSDKVDQEQGYKGELLKDLIQ